MATYKVPQDVEADDKLIGPFSFRQFIYLIVVALSGALAWGLAQIFIGLVIIPLPIIILFGALALPLRKDQPMEIYLAAMVSFYLKPRRRVWDGEGIETLIEITAPKTVEVRRTKDLSQTEAEQRLSYLADIVDSGGWAIRGVGSAPNSMAMNNDVFLEAQGAEDVLDSSNSVGQSFDWMMAQRTEQVKEEAMARMREIATTPEAPVQQPVLPATEPTTIPAPEFNPYPTEIHQTVIQPVTETVAGIAPEPTAPAQPLYQPSGNELAQVAASTSDITASADIINLATNSDGLSVETVSHEANRLKAKDDASDEVFISFR